MFRDSEKPILGTSVNISKTGMLVLAEETKSPGTLARFYFARFKGIGRVIWTRDSEPGIEFLNLIAIDFLPLEPDDRKVLDELLGASGE